MGKSVISYPKAEYHKADIILVNTPTKNELQMGVLHPQAALFECPFDPKHAMNEHLNFIELMKSTGATVLDVRDILLNDASFDNEEERKNAMSDLQELATKCLLYQIADGGDESEATKYKNEVIKSLSPSTLVDIILTHPTIYLNEVNKNTGLEATYSIQPMMNFHFLRDQSITTCKGVVISNMNSPQRSSETDVIGYVYNKLNIHVLHKVSEPGYLEGGDFIPTGDVDFIAEGLRTNNEGIQQLISKNVFCADKLVVVKDYWKNQEQMHLDTFFNIAAPKKAVLVSNRLNAKYHETLSLHADVYLKINGSYSLVEEERDFVELLQKDLGYQVVEVSVDDQAKYGVNFLTMGPDKVIGIDGVSQKYKDDLKSIGIDSEWVDFGNLTCGYGAAHCTTQVISRHEVSYHYEHPEL